MGIESEYVSLAPLERETRRFFKLIERQFFFYRHGVDGVFTYVSPSVTNVLGYAVDEFATHYTTYLTDNPVNLEVMKYTKLSIQGVQQPSYYVEIRHKNGSVRMLLVTEYPFCDQDGNVVAVEGIAQDVTQQTRDQEALFQQRQREIVKLFRRVALHMEDLPGALAEITSAAARMLDVERVGIWRFDRDDTMLRCLDLFTRASGSHDAGVELQVQDYPVYFSALEEERTINAERAQVDPRTQELLETYLRPLDIHSMLDAPILQRGRALGVICHEQTGHERHWTSDDQRMAASFADLTALAFEMHERARTETALEESSRRNRELAEELMEANENLKGSNERLQELNRLKSEFLAMVSHELRTPIAAMSGAMEILVTGRAGALDPCKERLIEVMRRNCARLGSLIENLLDLSQIEAGRFVLNARMVDLRTAVGMAVETARSLAVNGERSIHYDNPPAPIMAFVDEHRVVQVVLNLLDNALRFAHHEVCVTLSIREDSARIVVDDDGEGIPPERIAYMFHKFNREGLASDFGGHLGLGLSIVRALVEAQGGTVAARNRAPEARGTRIVVTLPCRSPAE